MGYGDKLMAIGDAWALHQADPQKRRVAIGNGHTIDPTDIDLCWGLDDFLVPPEVDLSTEDCLWVHSTPGNRPYLDYAAMREKARRMGYTLQKTSKVVQKIGHYIFVPDYRATPAPIKLKPAEEKIAEEYGRKPFVLIEPYIKRAAPPSKQWPVGRFHSVARHLQRDLSVYQISAPDRPPLPGVSQIRPDSFRSALAYMKAAKLYIGPEGGLHHAAAAMGTPAVVLFGGFISPKVTGYDMHVNLTGDSGGYACGTRFRVCPHCDRAMSSITPEDVVYQARKLLQEQGVKIG